MACVIRSFQTIFFHMTLAFPKSMLTPFSSSEVKKAVWILKNNKSTGMDQINVEIIKYSPEVVHKKLQIYATILQQQESIEMNHARNFNNTTKARKTEGTNIKSSTNNSFIRT